jgi:hypothetical protein
MGYLIRAPLGLGLFLGGIVLFNVKLVSLLETGTCASGTNTPYLVVHKCPSGTGTDILLLVTSIFGGLIGAALFASRGKPPWDRDRPVLSGKDFSFGFFAWGLFFTATGATSLVASLTDEAVRASQGGQLGGIIVGGTFLVMGIPALIWALMQLLGDLRGRNDLPATLTASTGGLGKGGAMSLPWGSTGPSSAGGGGTAGQIAKLERLQRLRESGALTDAEFEREKAKVLSE